MKKILSILLISIILFGCSKDPLKKSVIEPLEVDEIKQILEFEKESTQFRCCFELFYERVQEFHEFTKNDNLIKFKFENLLYGDYWNGQWYIHEFDKPSYGYLYSDSIKSLVDNNGWKKVQMYVSIFDTLGPVRETKERFENYNKETYTYNMTKDKHSYYHYEFPLKNHEIEIEMENTMREYIRNRIQITNDSINEIYEKSKSDKILLFEEFGDKMIELSVKNKRR